MPERDVRVDQLNLVVDDMETTVAFYRRLGLTVERPREWPAGSGALHAEATTPDGFRLEFDNVAMARIWHAGWRDQPPGSRRDGAARAPIRAARGWRRAPRHRARSGRWPRAR